MSKHDSRHKWGKQAPIVDVHAHIVTPTIVAAAREGTELHGVAYSITADGRLASRWEGRDRILPWPDFAEPISQRLENMDKSNVDAHVLSFSPNLINYEIQSEHAIPFARMINDEIALIISDHPDRFYGFGYLPLQDPEACADELARLMALPGFIGAILGTNEETTGLDDPAMHALFESAVESSALMFIHPIGTRIPGFLDRYHMRNLIGNPLATTLAFTSMLFGGVLDRFPSLQLCLAHGGGYACLGIGRIDHGYLVRPEAIASEIPSSYLKRVYVDSLVHDQGTLRLIMDRVGPDRVLLGSDYPADMGQPDPIGWVRGSTNLTHVEQSAVLGDNFARMLAQLSRDA